MIENNVGRRLIRLIPLVLAAGFLIFIGPEKLQQLQAKERWGLLFCVLIAFLASSMLGKYLRPMATRASVQREILVAYMPPNRRLRNPVVLHSTLAPEVLADVLRRSIDVEAPHYRLGSFVHFDRAGST